MAENRLDQAQRLVDQLTPLEQLRLMEYLTTLIARVVTSQLPNAPKPNNVTAEAWQEFFRVGDALAASDRPEGDTLTASLLAMRR
jgi:hypothetical protein